MGMKTGIELIATELQEQIYKYGFTEKHDAGFSGNLFLGAAEFLINKDRNKFPYQWDLMWMQEFESKSRIEQLIISGAFIAAEIDRMQAIPDPPKQVYQTGNSWIFYAEALPTKKGLYETKNSADEKGEYYWDGDWFINKNCSAKTSDFISYWKPLTPPNQ